MKKIKRKEKRTHLKASETYIDVIFSYPNFMNYETSIPINYRRTGTHIEENEIDKYLLEVYKKVAPSKWKLWKKEQKSFWSKKPRAKITKSFFNVLSRSFRWCCVSCDFPENPNGARRIQDIKEFGYTISTNTSKHCLKCKKKSTHHILVPLNRGGVSGYEKWSKRLRTKIILELKAFDAYEGKPGRKEHLLPDHKFPEIRWISSTRRKSIENLTKEDIKRDFQLLSNQRNQQKREVCRKCLHTGHRGSIYGIPFFYEGNHLWNKKIPKTGKKAEKGCIGCGWYDIEKWRSELKKKLKR